jgi:hypothetical protein
MLLFWIIVALVALAVLGVVAYTRREWELEWGHYAALIGAAAVLLVLVKLLAFTPHPDPPQPGLPLATASISPSLQLTSPLARIWPEALRRARAGMLREQAAERLKKKLEQQRQRRQARKQAEARAKARKARQARIRARKARLRRRRLARTRARARRKHAAALAHNHPAPVVSTPASGPSTVHGSQPVHHTSPPATVPQRTVPSPDPYPSRAPGPSPDPPPTHHTKKSSAEPWHL